MNSVILSIRMIVSILLSMGASVDDYKRYRISNRIIVAGFIAGLSLIFGDIALGCLMGDEFWRELKQQWIYLTGFISAFVISYTMYLVKGIGAGDVKLFAVLGLILGMENILRIIAFSMVAGVVIGIVEMKVTGNKRSISTLYGIKLHVFHFSFGITAGIIINFMILMGGMIH
ncbi:MAG: prepilin peptidase [Eubacteriales bacterium]|nr:prepilin peptidase [Eubacteriales bacterium]